MFIFVTTVFVIIPLICTKIDTLFPFPRILIGIDSLLGAIPLIIGGILALWCVILFFIVGKGTPSPLYPPEKFVVRGSYKYTRNPMMLALWLTLIGEALTLHSLTLLLFTVFISVPAGVLFVTKREERDLEKRFGNEYLEYKRKVPRWIPKPQAIPRNNR